MADLGLVRYDWQDGSGEPIDWWEDEELRPENLVEYEWIPSVELVLEVPKHAVLLSDEDNWNAVLSPYPASDPNDVLLSDEELEAKLDAEFDAVDWSDENRRFEQCRSTFDRIFDVRPLQSASGKQWNGRNVQACLWEIEPKWITSYRTYLEPIYLGTGREVAQTIPARLSPDFSTYIFSHDLLEYPTAFLEPGELVER